MKLLVRLSYSQKQNTVLVQAQYVYVKRVQEKANSAIFAGFTEIEPVAKASSRSHYFT